MKTILYPFIACLFLQLISCSPKLDENINWDDPVEIEENFKANLNGDYYLRIPIDIDNDSTSDGFTAVANSFGKLFLKLFRFKATFQPDGICVLKNFYSNEGLDTTGWRVSADTLILNSLGKNSDSGKFRIVGFDGDFNQFILLKLEKDPSDTTSIPILFNKNGFDDMDTTEVKALMNGIKSVF